MSSLALASIPNEAPISKAVAKALPILAKGNADGHQYLWQMKMVDQLALKDALAECERHDLFFLLGDALRNIDRVGIGDWFALKRAPDENSEQRKSRMLSLLSQSKKLTLTELEALLKKLVEDEAKART
jgi:hypothetical protein